MDDTVIVNDADTVHMVVNGATKWLDIGHFKKQMETFEGKVHMDHLEDEWQLLALQGPGAATALAKILPSDFDLRNMAFMTGANTTLDGIKNCRITRSVGFFPRAFLHCALLL
jgi:aminomethyltransferase